MIRIFNEEQFDKDFIDIIKNSEDSWSFPIKEIDYLLLEHTGESFILIGNRLYEYIL